jgi:hypothetical protein
MPYHGRGSQQRSLPSSPCQKSARVKCPVLCSCMAVVAQHFRNAWVKKWNDHGFAVISIAVEGQTDERDPANSKAWKQHTWLPRINPDIGPSLRSRFRNCCKINGLWRSRPDRLPASVSKRCEHQCSVQIRFLGRGLRKNSAVDENKVKSWILQMSYYICCEDKPQFLR